MPVSGRPPGPVTDAGDDFEVTAECLDVGAHDLDAGVLAVLYFGYSSLGYAKGRRG